MYRDALAKRPEVAIYRIRLAHTKPTAHELSTPVKLRCLLAYASLQSTQLLTWKKWAKPNKYHTIPIYSHRIAPAICVHNALGDIYRRARCVKSHRVVTIQVAQRISTNTLRGSDAKTMPRTLDICALNVLDSKSHTGQIKHNSTGSVICFNGFLTPH